MAVSFIGGGNQRKPLTCRKTLLVTDKLYHDNVVSSAPLLSGVKTHNVSGDSTDCIGSYTIKTTTAQTLILF